jgi:hypothetical protein
MMIKIYYKFIHAKFIIKLNNLDSLTFFLLNILLLISILDMNNQIILDKNIVFANSEITTRDSYNNNGNYDVNISNIPAKKITLGDIDIAYKNFWQRRISSCTHKW